MTKKQKTAYHILLVLISALFLFTGFDKVRGDPMAVAGFAQAGLPAWFMYMIGIGEILGAVGLWFSGLFRYAYEGLYIVLAGAVVTTAVFISVPEALFPLIVGVILGFLVRLHGKKMAGMKSAQA